jgi:ferric iron reductase protein FhuF
MVGQEILSAIDKTLDQLIKNAEVINEVNMDELSELEKEAFQRTQESLMARLIHMDEMLSIRRDAIKVPNKRSAIYKVQEKLLRFRSLSEKSPPQSLSLLGWKKVKRIRIRKNRKKAPVEKAVLVRV